MAGLPKAVFVLLIVAIASVSTGLLASAQTEPVVLPPAEDTQTDSNVLQPVFDIIDANPNADGVDQDTLRAVFEEAVTLELLSPEQALAMLVTVEWGVLTDLDALAEAAFAIQTILADLIAGILADDPLFELSQLLNILATPEGTLNAIGKAGASEAILEDVAELVAGGVPPGILVRITKAGLRNGLTMEEIQAQLAALEASVDEGMFSWGQIANEVTGVGGNKHQESEQNVNENGGDEGAGEEQEEEDNANGSSNGKKDDNPGRGHSKNSNKNNDKK